MNETEAQDLIVKMSKLRWELHKARRFMSLPGETRHVHWRASLFHKELTAAAYLLAIELGTFRDTLDL